MSDGMLIARGKEAMGKRGALARFYEHLDGSGFASDWAGESKSRGPIKEAGQTCRCRPRALLRRRSFVYRTLKVCRQSCSRTSRARVMAARRAKGKTRVGRREESSKTRMETRKHKIWWRNQDGWGENATITQDGGGWPTGERRTLNQTFSRRPAIKMASGGHTIVFYFTDSRNSPTSCLFPQP